MKIRKIPSKQTIFIYLKKKKSSIVKIWGINNEKAKKNWVNLPFVNILSLYLKASVLIGLVRRFI